MKSGHVLKQMVRCGLAAMLLIVFVAAMYGIGMRREEGQTEEGLLPTPMATPPPSSPAPLPSPVSAPQEGLEGMGQQGIHAGLAEVWEVWNFLTAEEKEEMSRLLENRCILIQKPAGAVSCEMEEDLLCHSIRLVISGTCKGELQPMSVLRVVEGEYILGEPRITPTPLAATQAPEEVQASAVSNDLLMQLSAYSYEEGDGFFTELSMMLNGYYLPKLHETEQCYVISLTKPKEAYGRIVVVDAGHGGRDLGAVADHYKITEASINLKLLLYLKEYLDSDGTIQAYYTRVDDSYPTLPERVELANGVEADLFVSFHCNSTVQPKSNGTEIMYNAEQGAGESFNSKEFAKLCLKLLTEALGTRSGGIIKRPDLHIVRRAEMPVVLIETAYLSNQENLKVLKDDAKLKKAAEAIYQAILKAYQEMGTEG